MKMHLKRIVSAVCALALCASVVATPALATDNTGNSDAAPGSVQMSEPEPTPEVTADPEPTPEVVSDPEPTPEVVSDPEPTPEVAADPEPTPEVAADPEPTPEATEQPEATPGSDEMQDTSNRATTYSAPDATEVSVNVNGTEKIGSDQGFWHSWDVQGNGDKNHYISFKENDGTMTITGLKATGSKTVTVTHTYYTVDRRGLHSNKEVFSVTVFPEEPAKIYFYVSIPTNEAMSSNAADYRFLTVGGTVKNPESLVEHQENDPIISFDDETILTNLVDTWPQTDEDGKIYLDSTNGYGSTPVDESSWIQLENGKITDFDISFSYVDEHGETQKAEYKPTDSEGNTYALRWTKFSYANTTDANWQFHMDAMLYQSVTVEEALTEIHATKHIDGNALNESGDAAASTFNFTLSSTDQGRTFTPLALTATVAAGDETANIIADEKIADTELVPGNYVITETNPDSNVWNTPADGTIEFTVASDGSVTVKTGTNDTINNTLKKYTVTYSSGVEGDAYVSNMPEQSEQTYAYNASTNVAAAPKRTGYEFTGWLGSDGNPYEPGAPLSVTGDITFTAQWSALDTGSTGTTGTVEIGKTASDLVNNQTNVTLSIGADQKKVGSDVVFVLDKSTSTDVKDEALAMLDELMSKAQENALNVKVGVVTFNKTADNPEFTQELTPLNEDSYKAIQTIFSKELKDGTNMEAGIRAGMKMLADDDTVYDTNKHLVLVSDGVTYRWGDNMTVYVHLGNTWAASVDMVHPDYQYRSKDFEAYKKAAEWMDDAQKGGIEEVIEKYQTPYTVDYGSDIRTVAPDETKYSSLECAIYMAGKAWQDAADAGYHLYAYAPNDYINSYPWAPNFVSGMYTIGGTSTLYSDTDTGVEGMFDEVEDTILYTIQNGTVNDVIGNDFDLAGLDTFQLKVGGQTVEADEDKDTTDNTISFGNGQYTVTYYPETEGTDEYFVWGINTPVKSNAGLQLTYTLDLVNQQKAVGNYIVDTNEKATLNYTSTTGDSGTKDFPVPKVDYDVVGIIPADLTIYMGGSEGYENIVDEKGNTIKENVSLPEPGFYLDIPDGMDADIRAALGEEASTIVDLSKYVTLTATVKGQTYEWNLKRYGTGEAVNESAGFIEDENGEEGRFIYKIVPKEGSAGVPIRIKVTKENQEATGSDEFEISDSNSLYDTYQMEIAGENIKPEDLKMTFDIPEDKDKGVNPYYRTTGVNGESKATLTVRYVVGEQNEVVTPALNDISERTDSNKAYVVLTDLEGQEKATNFAINEIKNGYEVKIGPESVSLLFDDIADTKGTAFEETLVSSAAKNVGTTFKDMKSEAKYLDLVDADNGNAWLTTQDKVTVYWPYPAGTNEDTTFYLEHFDGIDRDNTIENITGEVSSTTPTPVTIYKNEYGIYFETDSFSPYVLLWDGAKNQPAPPTDDGDNNNTTTTTNNNTTTTTVNVTNNAAAPAQPEAAAVIPQTGDEMPVGLLGGVAAVAAAAFVALFVIRKRKKN